MVPRVDVVYPLHGDSAIECGFDIRVSGGRDINN